MRNKTGDVEKKDVRGIKQARGEEGCTRSENR